MKKIYLASRTRIEKGRTDIPKRVEEKSRQIPIEIELLTTTFPKGKRNISSYLRKCAEEYKKRLLILVGASGEDSKTAALLDTIYILKRAFGATVDPEKWRPTKEIQQEDRWLFSDQIVEEKT